MIHSFKYSEHLAVISLCVLELDNKLSDMLFNCRLMLATEYREVLALLT